MIGSGHLGPSNIKQWQVGDGLDIVFVPYPSAPVAAVEMWYHVGSREDPPNRRGLAHMFEHLMFLGSENLGPDEHAKAVDRLGGMTNAFTDEDVTSYINIVPVAHVDFALELEAERMAHLVIDRATVRAECAVVKEELRLLDNAPVQVALRHFRALAFSQHPYRWLPAGSIEDIDRATVADFRRFYETYYVPNNTTLVVVADIDEEQLRTWVELYFGGLERGADPPPRAAAEPRQTVAKRLVLAPSEIGMVAIGYKIPEARHPDLMALRLIERVLGAGESSRLTRFLVRERGCAQGVMSIVWPMEDPGLFAILGFAYPGTCVELEAGLLHAVARLREQPIGEDELVRACKQLEADTVFGLQDMSNLAMKLGASKYQRGDPAAWLADRDALLALTPEQIQQVARAYLNDQNLSMLIMPTVES